ACARAVTTCMSHGSGVDLSSTQTPRFWDLVFGPSAATARRMGSWLHDADHIVGVEPSGSGHVIGTLPHVFLSPMFQTFITGTLSRPLLTKRCGSLAGFAMSGSRRPRISAPSSSVRAHGSA